MEGGRGKEGRGRVIGKEREVNKEKEKVEGKGREGKEGEEGEMEKKRWAKGRTEGVNVISVTIMSIEH